MKFKKLPEKWRKCIASNMGLTLDKALFINIPNLMSFFQSSFLTSTPDNANAKVGNQRM